MGAPSWKRDAILGHVASWGDRKPPMRRNKPIAAAPVNRTQNINAAPEMNNSVSTIFRNIARPCAVIFMSEGSPQSKVLTERSIARPIRRVERRSANEALFEDASEGV